MIPTTCYNILFVVTFVYNLVLAAHSSVESVQVFSEVHSALLMPTTKTPDLKKMLAMRQCLPVLLFLVVPGQAGEGMHLLKSPVGMT